jgi:hypothetical protein
LNRRLRARRLEQLRERHPKACAIRKVTASVGFAFSLSISLSIDR